MDKKEWLGDKWFYGKNHKHEDDFVFTQRNGKAMYVSTPSQWSAEFSEKHDLRKITFHGLRHTNTTILISEGIGYCWHLERLRTCQNFHHNGFLHPCPQV
ncbi:hypothetical protein CIW83_20955 [Tissierella sp. P1]|uniref:tyrosine-type recombinase/integrase n=1 Tax=Tissierella sp. P1 TaxID=1280483 RepID=UPI000BA0F24F|nr:hypothetical protein CIW83_20955 [Tissierella sp. P1]